MGGDGVSAVWICVYGNDWALGVAVGFLSVSHLSGSAFLSGNLKEAGEEHRFSTGPYIRGTALGHANGLSGQLRVQVGGIPVLPAFGEAPVFDAHD